MCPNATVGGTGEGGKHPGGIPDVSRFRTDGPEGESSMFAMLGMRGGLMGFVFGFVLLF